SICYGFYSSPWSGLASIKKRIGRSRPDSLARCFCFVRVWSFCTGVGGGLNEPRNSLTVGSPVHSPTRSGFLFSNANRILHAQERASSRVRPRATDFISERSGHRGRTRCQR